MLESRLLEYLLGKPRGGIFVGQLPSCLCGHRVEFARRGFLPLDSF